MKKLKLKKVIARLLIGASVLALNPIGASAEWRQSSGENWWYSEGNSWATGWRQIDGKWYYFNNEGYMKFSESINGYHLGENGAWDGVTSKSLLIKDDFNNFSSTDANKGNFIDWAKNNGYTWAYSTHDPGDASDKNFKTNRNIGLGDSLEDIEKAYGYLKLLSIYGDHDLCSTYPNWKSLSVTNAVDMIYYDDYGNENQLMYYLNDSHKVVMIAYFKNKAYITKNDMKWS